MAIPSGVKGSYLLGRPGNTGKVLTRLKNLANRTPGASMCRRIYARRPHRRIRPAAAA
jgi:hypothetical protein